MMNDHLGDSQVVVITGSTRGLGLGLARAFRDRGCAVVISGRQPSVTEEAAGSLKHWQEDDAYVFDYACDVTVPDQVQALWDASVRYYGKVDIWINNAGLGHPLMSPWEASPELASQIIRTNLLGAIYGARVAMRGMLDQGYGSIYFMEGAGSGGRRIQGLSLYETSKAGLHHFVGAMVAEAQGTPVLVGALRPGMVVTDLVMDQFKGREEAWRRSERLLNIISDRVETVAPWLAQKILENRESGVTISWLTRGKLLSRFLTAPFQRRQVYP